MSDQYVPALRQRFLEDVRIKVLQPKTQTMCLRAIREVTRFLGPPPDRDGPVTEVLSLGRSHGSGRASTSRAIQCLAVGQSRCQSAPSDHEAYVGRQDVIPFSQPGHAFADLISAVRWTGQ